MDLAAPVANWVKIKENEKSKQYLHLAWELKKVVDHYSNTDADCNWRTSNSLQGIEWCGWKIWKLDDEFRP